MTIPLRALIYARYSSDLQSASSTEDQIRVCRRLCEAHGWTVVQTFEDAAISGASHLRPGFQRLQEAARDGLCDVIVAEALDRLSRDQEHMAVSTSGCATTGSRSSPDRKARSTRCGSASAG